MLAKNIQMKIITWDTAHTVVCCNIFLVIAVKYFFAINMFTIFSSNKIILNSWYQSFAWWNTHVAFATAPAYWNFSPYVFGFAWFTYWKCQVTQIPPCLLHAWKNICQWKLREIISNIFTHRIREIWTISFYNGIKILDINIQHQF